MKAKVYITLKPGLLDAQGKTVKSALEALGFKGVNDVRIGKYIEIEGKGLLARAFCHEMDHLNGKFFLDHLSFLKRDLIKRKIRKLIKQGEWEKDWDKEEEER